MIYLTLFIEFAKVSIFCVGGGYASMPLIQAAVVEKHAWMSLSEFVDIFTISQMTPGPIGINAATFAGMKVAGTAGADLFRVQDAPTDLSAYDVVALGYWLRRGGPDDLMKTYLPKVKDACVLLFQTHGTDVGSEHAVTSHAPPTSSAQTAKSSAPSPHRENSRPRSSPAARNPIPTTHTTAPRHRSVGYAPPTIRTRRIAPPHAHL